MKIPDKFNDIRPWEPEDYPEVFGRLLANEQFCQVLSTLYPNVPLSLLAAKLKACTSPMQFQLEFIYGIVQKIMAKASTGYTLDATALNPKANYTFISNHRDIVLDSALLDKLLVDAHFTTTCEIAIGDNLLSIPWVKDVVRLNKAFIVRRGLPMREMLQSSKLLSEYMHFAIAEKHQNIWIAQREGRAKDSNDLTQEGILKMMTMGGEGQVPQRLKQLHLVPTAISYEYDPCDFLKAREFQYKRDVPGWKKSAADDVESMRTGIMGYKGSVHYHCAPCLDNYLDSLDSSMPKGEMYRNIASYIDFQIHFNYHLYPNNYAAIDLLHGTIDYTGSYTEAEKQRFNDYVEGQVAKIDMPGKDHDYLRERILTMYANPALNYLKAHARQA